MTKNTIHWGTRSLKSQIAAWWATYLSRISWKSWLQHYKPKVSKFHFISSLMRPGVEGGPPSRDIYSGCFTRIGMGSWSTVFSEIYLTPVDKSKNSCTYQTYQSTRCTGHHPVTCSTAPTPCSPTTCHKACGRRTRTAHRGASPAPTKIHGSIHGTDGNCCEVQVFLQHFDLHLHIL